MKKSIIRILLISSLLLSGCNNSDHSSLSNVKTKDEVTIMKTKPIDLVQKKVDSMNLDEKIGQLVIVGLDGYSINNNITNLIKQHKVSGVILFSKNVENSNQLVSLINSIKTNNSLNKAPLFVSVDEEGGRVSRMPYELKKLPSNQIIGNLNDSDLSYNIGKIIGDELKIYGFNMDFAPVLDINSNPNNPIIGDRSFGNNSNIVSKLGIKTMKGMSDNNVIPVVKHFPGHGDTSVDSHVGLPLVNKDINELNNFELLPFKNAIKNNADAIMVAHILLSKIDNVNPASMSKVVITDILRKKLKFNGVVITDDMTMAAIIKYNDIGDAAIKSFNSGSDIILVCHEYANELKVINSLKTAVQNKTISEKRLNESVYRILKLKEKYKINNDTLNTINTNKINEINDKIKSFSNN
ncbi:beta-N-acetylhexosaminidase [Clostridium estertheticum]|uniref:beta-N-acetylhexosaminidase n=1 Tax=Clostridium estertheticum subsp. estertheticum TaxID=1552 RepID=A0A1J0GI81_9CLOT|nr:beta-N-acetylhexosaminidase [Clostridium estertheticum]APC40672.1 glycoside hydrolase family 3 [Clostridium estertheticum subsp. estertheticum]MBU3170896.1 beta-N-acetylhexosaminidase [Clostridium estertheticum]MBZ9617498.1 beta-N-acetylhexosaminidase [Clostridium estertheticum subsp. laramiense]WAG73176.1 beta-N-acetylhexosaminidase [Clostridium estertheticum]